MTSKVHFKKNPSKKKINLISGYVYNKKIKSCELI